jgi:hypothetical protein
MAREGKPVPGERGHGLGIVLVEFQPRQDLGAHALDRVLVESGLGQRKAHEIEHLVLVGGQRLHIAEHDVAASVEIHAHGEPLLALLEGDGIQVARALVHHGRDEIGQAFLAGVILGGAAAEGEAHGDQGVGVALDEPGFDAAGARDALDLHEANLGSLGACDDERRGREPHAMPNEEERKPEAMRHDGYDLPLPGAWAGFSPMLLVNSGAGSR